MADEQRLTIVQRVDAGGMIQGIRHAETMARAFDRMRATVGEIGQAFRNIALGSGGIGLLAVGIARVNAELQDAELAVAGLYSTLGNNSWVNSMAAARVHVKGLQEDAAKGVGQLSDYIRGYQFIVAQFGSSLGLARSRELNKLSIAAAAVENPTTGVQTVGFDIKQAAEGGISATKTPLINAFLSKNGVTEAMWSRMTKAEKGEALFASLQKYSTAAAEVGKSFNSQWSTLIDKAKTLARVATQPIFGDWTTALANTNAWLDKIIPKVDRIAQALGGRSTELLTGAGLATFAGVAGLPALRMAGYLSTTADTALQAYGIGVPRGAGGGAGGPGVAGLATPVGAATIARQPGGIRPTSEFTNPNKYQDARGRWRERIVGPDGTVSNRFSTQFTPFQSGDLGGANAFSEWMDRRNDPMPGGISKKGMLGGLLGGAGLAGGAGAMAIPQFWIILGAALLAMANIVAVASVALLSINAALARSKERWDELKASVESVTANFVYAFDILKGVGSEVYTVFEPLLAMVGNKLLDQINNALWLFGGTIGATARIIEAASGSFAAFNQAGSDYINAGPTGAYGVYQRHQLDASFGQRQVDKLMDGRRDMLAMGMPEAQVEAAFQKRRNEIANQLNPIARGSFLTGMLQANYGQNLWAEWDPKRLPNLAASKGAPDMDLKPPVTNVNMTGPVYVTVKAEVNEDPRRIAVAFQEVANQAALHGRSALRRSGSR